MSDQRMDNSLNDVDIDIELGKSAGIQNKDENNNNNELMQMQEDKAVVVNGNEDEDVDVNVSVDPNYEEEEEESALIEFIKTLNEENVNRKNTDDGGKTPMMVILSEFEVSDDKIDFVDILTKMKDLGADIELTDYQEWTALEYAVEHGHTEAVRYILSANGFDGFAKRMHTKFDTITTSALDLARFYEHDAIVKIMEGYIIKSLKSLNEDNVNERIYHGTSRTPMMQIITELEEPHLLYALVKLKEFGANVELTDVDGWTVLHYAAYHGQADAVNYILSSFGFNGFANGVHKIQSKCNYTALDLAKCYKEEDVVEVMERYIFESRKALTVDNINEKKYKEGRTPMMQIIAELEGRDLLEALMTLKELGADIELTDDDGWTALHYAAYNGRAEAVECILSPDGFDGFVKGIHEKKELFDETALYMARNERKEEVVEILEDYIIKSFNSLNEDNINEKKYKDKATPIMNIMRELEGEKLLNALKMMKELGADVELRDEKGWTVLHYAVHYNHREAVKFILSPDGFDVLANGAHEIEDNYRQTALDLAKLEGKKDIQKVMEESIVGLLDFLDENDKNYFQRQNLTTAKTA